MKTEFTPIAMRCSREQFINIMPKLNIPKDMNKWCKDAYLVSKRRNNLEGVQFYSMFMEDYEMHEEWNEELFLKACGKKEEVLVESPDPVFIERYNITDKVKELLSECKKQGFSLEIDNGVIILKQI